MAEAASAWDGRVLLRPNVEYTSAWDADILHGCVCDPGWTGFDCSQLECPRGDDPLTRVRLVALDGPSLLQHSRGHLPEYNWFSFGTMPTTARHRVAS